MNKHLLIRQLFASVLLLVFAFSITPKRYLHDFFATHKDSCSKTFNTNQDQVNKLGFQCDCDQLVATSAFLESDGQIEFNHPIFYAMAAAEPLAVVFSNPPKFNELRGPPAIG